MRKNPHDRILKDEPKEQHISPIFKFCSNMYIELGLNLISEF